MAKGDLVKLIKQAEKYIGVDTMWYRSFLDLETHQFTMTLDSVLTAIEVEIGPDLYNANRDLILPEARAYISAVYRNIMTKNSLVIHMNGDAEGFTATLSAKTHGSIQKGKLTPTSNGTMEMRYPTSGTNVFRHINDAKAEPQKALVAKLNAILRTELNSKNFIDSGHDIGVADKQVRYALGTLNNKISKREDLSALAASNARLDIISKFEGPKKKFVISVIEESAKQNRSKASGEAAFKEQTLRILRQFVNENKDWAGQKGSSSKIEEITATLVNDAISNGWKGKKQKVYKSSSKASLLIKGRTKTTKSSNKENIKLRTKAQVSSINLINLLNMRLPEEVKKQMIKPSLVNRSGTFANSVRVVELGRSLQGYLTVTYDYKRQPYDVFDPVKGASPWNTPARDPKKIIERSIRSAAKDLIESRFYVRRVS